MTTRKAKLSFGLACLTWAYQVMGQVPTARDPTPWGVAVSRRGPAGAEDLIWAQLGRSAQTGHIATSLELLILHERAASDRQLAAGTYRPDLTAPMPRENVPAILASTLKQQEQSFQAFPYLAAVWTRPAPATLEAYLRQRYSAYLSNMQLRGEQAQNLATSCSYLVETEYRVLDPQFRPASAAERKGFRGTCIATIARAEKAGMLADAPTRGALAETLAIVAEGYNERLQYVLQRRDPETQSELTRFVGMDFEQIFRLSPSQVPAAQFPCVLLDDGMDQCAASLPRLQKLLNQVVASNP